MTNKVPLEEDKPLSTFKDIILAIPKDWRDVPVYIGRGIYCTEADPVCRLVLTQDDRGRKAIIFHETYLKTS